MPRCEDCGTRFKINWPFGKKNTPLFDGVHDARCPNKDKRGWGQFKEFKRRVFVGPKGFK